MSQQNMMSQQDMAQLTENQRNGWKECFGISWDPNNVNCAGRLDPGYISKSGSRRKDQCQYFNTCQQQRNKNNVQPKPPAHLVPTSNLLRNVQGPPTPATSHPMVGRPAYPAQPAQYQQPQMPHPMMMAMAQMVPPWMAQMGPAMAPMAFQAPGAQMPAYLAVGEDPMQGSYMGRLGAEVVRSIAKSAGHTTASYFDHNPIRRHQAPVEQPVHQEPEGQE
jgi:hypothetical protein